MKLEGLTLPLLTKAVKIYWGKAYSEGSGAMPRFQKDDAKTPEDVLQLFQKEVLELVPGHRSVRYTMRLGNRNYPFMKLLLQEHLIADEFYFGVDTHDEMEIKPDFPDYEGWMKVRDFNGRLKREIEVAFAGGGLDTSARLRQMVAERDRAEGQGQGKTILVVDDEEDLADCVGTLLEDRGYRVFKVYDGKAALKVSEELMPDLLLLDYELPELDGLEVIEALRKKPATAEIPVLLATASRVTQDEISRADGFLAKPFHETLLYEVVEYLLKSRKEAGR